MSSADVLGRIGFPGQQRLVDVEVAALEHAAVGRDEIAGDQFDDVTRNDLVHRDCDGATVAASGGVYRDRTAQRLDRVLRAHS